VGYARRDDDPIVGALPLGASLAVDGVA